VSYCLSHMHTHHSHGDWKLLPMAGLPQQRRENESYANVGIRSAVNLIVRHQHMACRQLGGVVDTSLYRQSIIAYSPPHVTWPPCARIPSPASCVIMCTSSLHIPHLRFTGHGPVKTGALLDASREHGPNICLWRCQKYF
jgi:hypothetical protein